jgi:uncharacterized tellurite resistance protein B-like protein
VFNDIIRALTGGASRLGDGPEALRLSVAALLVTAARADDKFKSSERRAIEGLLAGRFGLSTEEVEELVHKAGTEADTSADMFRYVQSVIGQSPATERVWLIEMLWEVAYADGELSPDEDALIRRVAGLVDVTDFERGIARRHVLDRLNARKD